MIRIRIVNGVAIDVEELRPRETRFSRYNKLLSIFDKFLIDRFQILQDNHYIIPVVEEHEYWARPVGNGKILLMLDITKNNI
ncbi:MAG: hypothetical protein WCI31_07815 [Prolixibacteraceae bacterium]